MKLYSLVIISLFVVGFFGQCSTFTQNKNTEKAKEAKKANEKKTETNVATVIKPEESGHDQQKTESDNDSVEQNKVEQDRLELERLKSEQDRLELEKLKSEQEHQEAFNAAVELKRIDEREEREADLAKQRYQERLPALKNEVDALIKEDELQESDYLIAKDKYVTASKIEAEYRNEKIDKVDPERNTFYRKDSESIFTDKFIVEDVVTNRIRLFRNRKAEQFIGYQSVQKYRPVVDLVPILTEPARRLRLYDFFKGRPGNYILLNSANEPISIRQNQREYQIVNIHSDGDVLILVDLESINLHQFHRISVTDILLIME